MKCLAKLKFLRGTRFDPFGYTAERKMERQLIEDYGRLIDQWLEEVSPHQLAQWVDILSLAQHIRGFGHVKLATVETYRSQLEKHLQQLHQASAQPLAA